MDGTRTSGSPLACVVDAVVDLPVEGLERDGVVVELVLELEDLAPQPAVLGQERGDRVLGLDDPDGQRAAPSVGSAL